MHVFKLHVGNMSFLALEVKFWVRACPLPIYNTRNVLAGLIGVRKRRSDLEREREAQENLDPITVTK
jgi:hypothetical protein